jgi:drug/metabolite transporter (DMT)-like permease
VAAGAVGNSLLRVGLSSAPPLITFSPVAHLKQFANVAVVAGVGALICRYILQLSLLSWADLTYAIPVTSAAYPVITIVGVFGLHEHVSFVHWMGVLLILCGVAIVGRTRPLKPGSGLN